MMRWEYKDTLYVEGKKREFTTRTVGDMRDVLFSKVDLEDDTVLYYMFRNVAPEPDAQIFKKHNIRYDITVMLPIELGLEFNKTYGHYHPLVNKKSYPEIYEVLQGKAYYLLQRKIDENVDRAILVVAEKGDKVLIPPNYGHVTINPTKETLIMANLVFDGFKSEYGDYREKGGACYYITTDKQYIPNKRYGDVPTLEVSNANFNKEGTIYSLFLANPKDFEFLKKPELCKQSDVFES